MVQLQQTERWQSGIKHRYKDQEKKAMMVPSNQSSEAVDK